MSSRCYISAFVLLFLLTYSYAGVAGAPNAVHEETALDYGSIINDINLEAVKQHARFFSNLETRLTGSLGCDQAARYIYEKLVEYGLVNVTFHEYHVAECIDHGANITILSTGELLQLYPLKHNFGAPSTTPPDGIAGRLIYAKDGHLEDFDGLEVDGSICLMDWDSWDRWLNAAKLGAKAAIFLPPTYIPDYAVPATVKVPFTFPRFYVKEPDAQVLSKHMGDLVKIVARTYWEETTARNVVGFIEGTEFKDKVILLSSYYDSSSITPSYAPGAQESLGISSLLEIAKWLVRNPPRYSVMIVAFSGHNQGLEGARAFAEDYVFPGLNLTERSIGMKILFHMNLDLSSGSSSLILPSMGDNIRNIGGFSEIFFRFLSNLGKEIIDQRPVGKTYEVYFEGFRPDPYRTLVLPYEFGSMEGFEWQKGRPEYTKRILDHEISTQVWIPAFSFTTALDPRPYKNRPYDVFEYVNFGNLRTQLEFIYCYISRLFNVEGVTLNEARKEYTPIDYGRTPPPGPLDQGWKKLEGRVACWNESMAWYNIVPNTLVRMELQPGGYVSGLRELVRWKFADQNGYFGFWGVGTPHTPYSLDAFVFDEETGNPIYLPDSGEHMYAPRMVDIGGVQVQTGVFHTDIGFTVVFKASSMVIFDALTPTTFSPPRFFGQSAALTLMPGLYDFLSNVELKSLSSLTLRDNSYSISIVNVPPETRFEIMLNSPTALRYPISFLINASKEHPEGVGYAVKWGEQYRATYTSLQCAENLYYSCDERLRILGNIDPSEYSSAMYKVHKNVGELIENAHKAVQNHEYTKAYEYASVAWRLGQDVYFYTRRKIEDSAFTVPILAAFLIPFILLFEKLVLNIYGRKKVLALGLIFVATVLLFDLIHPGFTVAASPSMIIIGFSIFILAVPILVISFGGALSYVESVRVRLFGRHTIQVGRTAQAVWAIGLGIENMRKRKLRTSLAFLSLVFMVVAFVVLASITPITVISAQEVKGEPLYEGIYVHRVSWGSSQPELGGYLLEFLNTRYANACFIAPRVWAYTDYGTYTVNAGWRLSYADKSCNLLAIWGLTHEEANVSGIDKFLVKGRWFLPRERYVCILPEKISEDLDATVGENVLLAGRNFTVIGIMGKDLEGLKDLDGQELTPLKLDIIGKNPYNMHIHVQETTILPLMDAIYLNGQIASISVKPSNSSIVSSLSVDIHKILSELLVYSNSGNKIMLYTYTSTVSIWGMEYQIVPWALLVLMLINIMLGGIYERIREINIYGALGLSPLHTAFLFLAEAMVYAVVGGMLGYIISMCMNKVVLTFVPSYLTLNFSSSAVVSALLISMLSMIVSSVYPMYKASRIVVPSLERAWKISTKPVGNTWEIPLPFYCTTVEETNGITAYIKEYVDAHIGEGSANFSATDVVVEKGEIEGASYNGLSFDARLFPAEIGVRQRTKIYLTYTQDRWNLKVVLEREEGATPQWMSLNRNFIDLLRKQLLLWRGLPEKEKQKYMMLRSGA